MEIPVINRMSEFEASINSLNNPSLIDRFFSIFKLEKSSLPHRIWKWGALFLALVYAFSSLAYRIKILILHYHNKSKSLLATASEPLLSHFDDEFSTSDDENDDVCSSSDDDDGVEEEEGPSSSYEDSNLFDDDFRVKGTFRSFSENPWQNCNFKLRRRRSVIDNFSLSDLVNGSGVVKLWENSILGEIPAVSMSPSVIISAGAGDDGVLGLGLWDLRMNRRSSAIQAEWRSDRKGRTVGIEAGRTGEVYVRDDVSMGLRVGDVRKLGTPLADLTEYEEDKWWDADDVSVKNDSTHEFTE